MTKNHCITKDFDFFRVTHSLLNHRNGYPL